MTNGGVQVMHSDSCNAAIEAVLNILLKSECAIG